MKSAFRTWAIAITLSILVLASLSATAFGGEKNVFAHLRAIESDRDNAAAEAALTRSRIRSLDDEIADRKRRVEVARRAAGPVRRKLGGTLGRWVRTLGQLERGASDERDDARQLLVIAGVDAIRPEMRDIDVLRKARGESTAFRRQVRSRLRQTLALAQHRASRDVREAEKTKIVQESERDAGVRDDLAKTEESLYRSLSHMLKNETLRDFHRLKGTLLPPVALAPVAVFGPRPHGETKVSTRHTGYTWKTPIGTPIKATAGGLVVYAHRLEGYGKLIIIDHGGGYHSLYAHLESIDVEMGEMVVRGKLIGATGETGSLEGPKLYFELRKDGQAVDPGEWFLRYD